MSVPVLRFKQGDGRDFPEWEQFNFFELLNDIWDYRGKTPNKLGMEWGGSIPSLSANNVKKGLIDLNAECNLGSEELYKKWMIKGDLSKNDIVFTMEAPLGNAALIPDDNKYILSQRVVVFKTKEWIENEFFLQILLSDNFQSTIDSLSTGTTAKGINQKSLSKVSLKLPTDKLEQTKIANFLSAVDEKITQLTQKHELLNQYKKGVMQQIFSQELRIKDDDGRDFPQWEERILGEVTTLFSRRNKNLIDAEVYSVTNSNGFVLQSEQFEDRIIAGSDLSNYKIIQKGEFAYNPARVNVGSIAFFEKEIGVISSLYVCFKCNPELDSNFFLYFLELDSTKQNINSFGEGGVRIYLWYPLFSQIPITLPSMQEQTKIANFLTAIKDKIIQTQAELDAVKQYKQGLLQQMFV